MKHTPHWLSVCLWALGLGACASGQVGPDAFASSVYARSDTNDTQVYSPRFRGAMRVTEGAGVEATYALDSWTAASIDITTAATSAVHEIRQEVTAGGHAEISDFTVSGSYRYSTENDYWSHGGVATVSADLAQNNTTIAATVLGADDIVGRAGDDGFRRSQQSIGGRASLTQVIDDKSLISLTLERVRITGYQASPYRFVAIGGDTGTCAGSASLCVPETHPSLRVRTSAVLTGRRAFGEHLSMGLAYRLYLDDWGLVSHTMSPDLAWVPNERDTVHVGYRLYLQSDASFYRARYAQLGGRYVTRDRELSPFYSQRATLGYDHVFRLGDAGHELQAGLRAGYTRFVYRAFVGLDEVGAVEGTALLSLQLH